MQFTTLFSLSRRAIWIALILTTVLFAMFSAQSLLIASAQEGTGEEIPGLVASLRARNNKLLVGTAEEVIVQVSITNSSDHPIKVLNWLTPVEGVQEPLFAVLRDGNPVAYLGPVYKRMAPTEQDYISIAPGESLTAEANLSDLYDFSTTGYYEISYDVVSEKFYLEESSGRKIAYRAGSVASNAVEMFVEQRKIPSPLEFESQAVSGSSSFYSCSTFQQTELVNARSSASTYANGAVAYFAANNHGSRYTTWFGAHDLSRYNTVSSHFTPIRNAMDSASMTFDCTCTEPGVYAYVYPYFPYKIYLCSAFWFAPTTGSDSKPGILVHEISHFKVVAGTVDHAYGQNASQALAATKPAAAIENADNYEYFAENNPALEAGAVLSNGDFELGKTSWTEYSSNGWSLIEEWNDGSSYPPLAHGGTWYAWLGGFESETSQITQPVYISAHTPYLKLSYMVNSTEVCGNDYGYVKLNSTVVHTWNLCSANSSPNWQSLKLDLSSYVGQTISLQFSAVTTASTRSDLFIDDVILYSTFGDVPATYWAWSYVERLYNAGITGGCSTTPPYYCPEDSVTRAQMAVFLEKGGHYPSAYSPPNVTPTFTDTAGHWAEDWIEALRSDGITGGCGTNLYCPEDPVTRAQMAVFLLKSKYGSSYTPPTVGPSTGFNDVPVTHWAAPWIKQLAAEGITGGCGTGIYCPESPVTRAQMAVFLVKTFSLP